MKSIFTLFIFCFCTVNVLNSQSILILQPDGIQGKDAYLSNIDSEWNTNFGENRQFVADAWLFSGLPGTIRSIIQFDLSSIPADAIISNAKLSLYGWDATSQLGQHSTQSGPNNCYLERITSSWNETNVSWNSQPTTTNVNKVSLPASTSDNQNYIDVDVTLLLQDMISNPLTSFGFMIKLQNEAYYRRMNFCSSDHPNSSLHPKLQITYTAESGLNEKNMNEEIYTIFPNPASQLITIQFNTEVNSNFVINIYNSIGEKIKSEFVMEDNSQINLQDLKNGIYSLEVITENGSNFQKLIIQN